MKLKPIAIELGRIVIGITFALSGFLKSVDPVGVTLKMQEFISALLGSYGAWLLPLSSWGAYFLVGLEFCIGAFLLMGIYRRLSTRLAFVMLIGFTLLTGYSYFTGAVSDCGCFGDALPLTPMQTFLKNLGLLPISLFLLVNATQIRHLYSLREQWIPALSALLGITYFVYANGTTYPYVDFRPYKVGYNLKDRIYQEDSLYQAQLMHDTRYVYERNGKRQRFHADSLPDSSWTFIEVAQPEHIKSYKPKYSFVLLDSLHEDVSTRILTDSVGVFLLLSPDWKQASQEKYESMNDLYRYLRSIGGASLYAVSPNDSTTEGYWRYQTGSEYPSLVMDATTIRTIIRSNPGLIYLKDGKIIDKIPAVYFPQKEEIANFVTKVASGHRYVEIQHGRIALLIVWAILWVIGIVRRQLRYVRAYYYGSKKPQVQG